MDVNYKFQHIDYLTVRDWAADYVDIKDIHIAILWTNHKDTEDHTMIDDIKQYPNEVELELLGEDPNAIELIREFLDAFEVYEKYIHISNPKDWDSPTIACLLEQLTTQDEWDKIRDFPSAAWAWFHHDDKLLIDGLSYNPQVLTYNYERITKAREELHCDLTLTMMHLNY